MWRFNRLLFLTVTLMSIDCFFASKGEEEEEVVDVRYAVLGASLGAFFGISFIAVKLCLLKKHSPDYWFSDSESFNLKAFRQGDVGTP